MSADVSIPAATTTAPVASYTEQEVAHGIDPLELAAALGESALGLAGGRPAVIYERGGSWSVALGAVAEVTLTRARARLTVPASPGLDRELPWDLLPLPVVDELLRAVPVSGWRAYGWAGFELAFVHAGLAELVRDDELLHLFVPAVEVRVEAGRALVRALDDADIAAVAKIMTEYRCVERDRPVPLDVAVVDHDDYRARVAAAVTEIRERRLQKVILSRTVPVDRPVDLVGTYVEGRRRNTPTRSFLVSAGGIRAAGFSPEIVVSVDADGSVTTQPLAGTRAFEGVADEDARRREDLLGDAKEIFEHAISVKVAHDELAPLCENGSVVVTEFMNVKERGSVQHLASSVTGRLAAGVDHWAAFAALFPAVTASGVPKPAAYHSIRRNEHTPRGLYSGAVVTIDHDGALDAALVLRTLFQRDGRTWLQAGAGIVEQSDPDREFEETCEKLRSVARHLVPARG